MDRRLIKTSYRRIIVASIVATASPRRYPTVNVAPCHRQRLSGFQDSASATNTLPLPVARVHFEFHAQDFRTGRHQREGCIPHALSPPSSICRHECNHSAASDRCEREARCQQAGFDPTEAGTDQLHDMLARKALRTRLSKSAS